MIELPKRQIIATEEELQLMQRFAAVTGNYQVKRFKLEDIYCEDELPDSSLILNGQTAFFRHFMALKYLFAMMRQTQPKNGNEFRVLATPSSIGCEANGLVGLALSYDFNNLRVDAFDRSQLFTDLAREGRYPSVLANRLEKWRSLVFDNYDSDKLIVPVKREIRERVEFLPATPFQDFQVGNQYDAVVINNLFQYLPPQENDEILKKVAEAEPSFILYTRIGADPFAGGLKKIYTSIEDGSFFNDDKIPEDDCFIRPSLAKNYGMWFRKDCAPA